jgi:multidrug efflux pump subunit AcrB
MRTIDENIALPPGYSIGQAGLSESMGETMVSMVVVFLSAILLAYMLLAAILENPLQPLFILRRFLCHLSVLLPRVF